MNKRMMIIIVAMTTFFIGWQFLMNYLYEKQGWWQPGQKEHWQAEQQAKKDKAQREAASRTATQATQAASAPATTAQATVAPSTQAVAYRVVGGSGKTALLGSTKFDDPQYSLAMALTPRGAGVESVTLNSYHRTAARQQPYTCQDFAGVGPAEVPLAARAIVIDGREIDLAHAIWQGEGAGASASYSVTIPLSADGSGLVVLKTFQLNPISQDPKQVGRGYEPRITYTLQNTSDVKIEKVKLIFNGPASLRPENANDIPTAVAGFDNEGGVVMQAETLQGVIEKGEALPLKYKKPLTMLWAGVSGAYFDMIVRPALENQKNPLAIASAKVVRAGADTREKHALVVFETVEVTLEGKTTVAPGGVATLPLDVFIGPKLRKILNSDYFAGFPRSYDQTLLTSGACIFCPQCLWSWMVSPIVSLLRGFHFVVRDWGLAIIVLVLLVRLVLHPITKASQVSMSKMSKMGPEMERIKKKYADNPEELRKAQTELFRQQGIGPMLGCLPMFLQMPIWIALWTALQSSFELRHAPFLWGLTWIKDLAQPDHLVKFSAALPSFLCLPAIDGINLLPVLMALVFWLQAKYTPKPPAASKEQETQQKMMQWMTLLFPLLLYSGPSGLNLYILTSTAFGIWESKRVREHVKQQEEAEKAGKILVEAPTTRAAKRLAKDEKDKQQTPPKRGLMGWLAGLQARAEDMRRDAERKRER